MTIQPLVIDAIVSAAIMAAIMAFVAPALAPVALIVFWPALLVAAGVQNVVAKIVALPAMVALILFLNPSLALLIQHALAFIAAAAIAAAITASRRRFSPR
jgi:hypothetical protein